MAADGGPGLSIGGLEEQISDARKREKRRGVWQPRYGEHTLEDEDDFERHFDYIHFNPGKHGHVRCRVTGSGRVFIGG